MITLDELILTWGLVKIPAGCFAMGSDSLTSDERPIHTVTLRTDFFMGATVVTRSQWAGIMNTRPWAPYDSDLPENESYPATSISWDDTQDFIRKLNQLVGGGFRLPSESEWEYACRAGSTGLFCFGDDDSLLEEFAWYRRKNAWQTMPHHFLPVAQKRPNAWGLYDMHGNVWELCEDKWHDNYDGAPEDGRPWIVGFDSRRVQRGGCWGHRAFLCRSAARAGIDQDDGSTLTGFRLAFSRS